MALHHRAVVLKLQRDLIVAILQASVLCANAPSSIHEPSIAQYGLADLVGEDDIVLEFNLSPIGILQKYGDGLLPQDWNLSPLGIL